MKHLIIDVETLGIQENAVILQFVAALHDGSIGETKVASWKLDAMRQKEYGRFVCEDTLRWWKNQHIDVQKASLIPSAFDKDPEVALTEFEEWLSDNGFNPKRDYIWQRGSMDHDWLASLYMSAGWLADKLPIKFFRVRDIRTAVDVLGYSEKLNGYPDNSDQLRARVPNYKQHDAESDVLFEVEVLREIGLIS